METVTRDRGRLRQRSRNPQDPRYTPSSTPESSPEEQIMKRITVLAATTALFAFPAIGTTAAFAATPTSHAQVAKHGADDPAGHHRHHGADAKPGHHRRHGAD